MGTSRSADSLSIYSRAVTCFFYRSCELSYIPPSIGDLCNFYVTPASAAERNVAGNRFFARDLTPTGPRSFERTASVKERAAGISREDIQLFLAVNNIRRLPRELFTLKRLTVLTLREHGLSLSLPRSHTSFQGATNYPTSRLRSRSSRTSYSCMSPTIISHTCPQRCSP